MIAYAWFVVGTSLQRISSRVGVCRSARRLAKRIEPLPVNPADGLPQPATFQCHVTSRLKAWVASLQRATASKTHRLTKHLRKALLNLTSREQDFARTGLATMGHEPILGGMHGYHGLVIAILSAVDLVMAWSPLERLGLPFALTLLGGIGLVGLLAAAASLLGWVGWLLLKSDNHQIDYRTRRAGFAAVVLLAAGLGVVIVAFSQMRSETNTSPWLWGAAMTLSVVYAIFLGAVYRDEGPLRAHLRARRRRDRAYARTVRRSRRLHRHAARIEGRAAQLHAAATDLLAHGADAFAAMWTRAHPEAPVPALPDPDLPTYAAVLNWLMQPLRTPLEAAQAAETGE